MAWIGFVSQIGLACACVEFGRSAAGNRERRGLGKPETFNFLGFTFVCSKSRRGKFQITASVEPFVGTAW